MNELYRALGRFVVRFSLVGATMVQAMVPPDEQRSKERALEFIEMDFSKLFGQWHKMMTEDAFATTTDRRTLTVINAPATLCSSVPPGGGVRSKWITAVPAQTGGR